VSTTENTPEFTFTVSTRGDWTSGAALTCGEIAAELRRLAGDLERDGNGGFAPDFSGEWHTVHPRGAVISSAYWCGGDAYTGDYPDTDPGTARHQGYPQGAWRPWLAAPCGEAHPSAQGRAVDRPAG
jgi:hypothetical protein